MSGRGLDVAVMFVPSLPVIRVRGALRDDNAHLVHDAVSAVVQARALGELVVLDLAEVTFAQDDSGRLVRMFTDALEAGGKSVTVLEPVSVPVPRRDAENHANSAALGRSHRYP